MRKGTATRAREDTVPRCRMRNGRDGDEKEKSPYLLEIKNNNNKNAHILRKMRGIAAV